MSPSFYKRYNGGIKMSLEEKINKGKDSLFSRVRKSFFWKIAANG